MLLLVEVNLIYLVLKEIQKLLLHIETNYELKNTNKNTVNNYII